MIKLISGNEALALGAYHSGLSVAAAYPGTPSTEILEALTSYEDLYAEWSTNEKVAMEVALGASYAGARSLACMKHVGLNVASDAFMAGAITGIEGGLVVVSADDPGIHSSQDEQDSRHYGRLGKVPVLEPGDSQEAYEFMGYAYDVSEKFDTLVLVRSTTRISHSKSLVNVNRQRSVPAREPGFKRNSEKYIMLPVNARFRRPIVEERLLKLEEYGNTSPLNITVEGERSLGIITNGISYHYAREVFPKASFLKLGMTYPLPKELIKKFAASVDKLLVIEELDPFLEENIKAMGIEVAGKEFIPLIGELNINVVENGAVKAGLLPEVKKRTAVMPPLPKRPPLLCPGCPHTGLYFVLSTIGKRDRLLKSKEKTPRDSELVITGDIGCYTLGAYPPLYALDTTTCMGASIGEALGIEKAKTSNKVVAVIGDSTFLHAGMGGLIDAVYSGSGITLVILDNGTTAMTGHQEHPGTGFTAQRKPAPVVDIESLVRGAGVKDVKVVDAFDMKTLWTSIRKAIDSPELSVVIVRGGCAVRKKVRSEPRAVDIELCDDCGVCLRLGCSAIQKRDGRVVIEASLCAGSACTICQQLCPRKAIVSQSELKSKEAK